MCCYGNDGRGGQTLQQEKRKNKGAWGKLSHQSTQGGANGVLEERGDLEPPPGWGGVTYQPIALGKKKKEATKVVRVSNKAQKKWWVGHTPNKSGKALE